MRIIITTLFLITFALQGQAGNSVESGKKESSSIQTETKTEDSNPKIVKSDKPAETKHEFYESHNTMQTILISED